MFAEASDLVRHGDIGSRPQTDAIEARINANCRQIESGTGWGWFVKFIREWMRNDRARSG